jgi:hypothetical protein
MNKNDRQLLQAIVDCMDAVAMGNLEDLNGLLPRRPNNVEVVCTIPSILLPYLWTFVHTQDRELGDDSESDDEDSEYSECHLVAAFHFYKYLDREMTRRRAKPGTYVMYRGGEVGLPNTVQDNDYLYVHDPDGTYVSWQNVIADDVRLGDPGGHSWH